MQGQGRNRRVIRTGVPLLVLVVAAALAGCTGSTKPAATRPQARAAAPACAAKSEP
ncbi:MAG: hypothetical protein JWN46_826, partial [Acidimicrobiales bacterium]|nr:hypothetical protein [Acidimicrobiales bacterium]